MIRYGDDPSAITAAQLRGFFEGWPHAPSPETHLRLLRGSDQVVLATDESAGVVAGFATAITDGVLCAYIPLLEVRLQYRGRGIGRQLVVRMCDALVGYYMIDLVCDAEMETFYEPLGFRRASAMVIRDPKSQAGR